MNIKELEITKEMYAEAKRVENLYHLTDKFEIRSEEFRKSNNEWIKADRDFQENFCDEFDTLEIVNEYERRERNTDNLLSKNQNVYEITYVGDTTKEFKFFACNLDKENKKLYVLRNNIYGNDYPAVIDAKNIKRVECIERNNNLDFQ